MSRGIIVARGQKNLKNKTLTRITNFKESKKDHNTINITWELQYIGWTDNETMRLKGDDTWGFVAKERSDAQETISRAPSSIWRAGGSH
jgi:hypothetical protein